MDRASPLRTSHLRDPVGPDLHFGSEQFIDELAVATGEDSVAFRIKYASKPRAIAALKAVAEKAGWQPRVSGTAKSTGDILSGRGIAYTERRGTVVATVCEVEVNRKTGKIWAKKFTVAHDCGVIVNPQGLTQTIEGNVIHGLSRTILEEVRFDANSVTSVDWSTYPIVEIQDVPLSVDVVLINHPEIAPTGAGEPTIRSIPAAIANAFFDATGVRLRTAPMTPERVLAALAKA
jgi:CO/xanthine dehydrogenase Mo-binding subunit